MHLANLSNLSLRQRLIITGQVPLAADLDSYTLHQRRLPLGVGIDWNRMNGHLMTWCKATAMKENADKREGQLVGKLNKQRGRAPRGIIRNEAWVLADGDTIRALGVPMGNNIDLDGWWDNKYREVKQRLAMWKTMGSMSLTGRN